MRFRGDAWCTECSGVIQSGLMKHVIINEHAFFQVI